MKALELSWEEILRQYCFITHWMSAATISYIQTSNSQSVTFSKLSQEENQLAIGLQKLLHL